MRRKYAGSILACAASVVLAGAMAGCGGGGGYGSGVSLISRNPARRIPAMKAAVANKDLASSAEPLIKALSSEDPAERFYAIEALERLTGETRGYVYFEDARARAPAVQRWKQWLGERQAEAKR